MKRAVFITFAVVFALTSCQQAKNKVFELASKEANKKCPMIIDESTRMDSTAFIGKKNTFCYFYTLIGMEEDSTSIATLKAEMAERIPKYLKKTVEMKPYKEAKVTLQYTYFSDNTKEKLFQLEIPADKY